uniref:Uncharacterized protein n=1 Tax=Pithovirus LCPAC201 TaxID=2506591 RepID=A0A481Z601_9VIRU|nr:MAG: hypothetical protein LCPAC201_01330 [Pithovirus LCPAC201]
MNNRLNWERPSSFQTPSIDQCISLQLSKPWKIPSYISSKLPNHIISKLGQIDTHQYQNLKKWLNPVNIPNILGCEGQNYGDENEKLIILVSFFTLNPFSNRPEAIALYNTLSHFSKIILVRMITGGDYRSLFETSSGMLQSITCHDYLYPDSLQNMSRKYQVYNQHSTEVKWVLSEIYGLPLTVIANLSDRKRDKLENIILKYNGVNYLDLAKEIGMHILPNQDNPTKYFILNFTSYRKVINRPHPILQSPVTISSKLRALGEFRRAANQSPANLLKYLSQSTDLEIFQYVGFFVPYASRKSLLKNVMEIIDRPKFFIPFQRNPVNLNTTLLTPINDPIFMVGYGTNRKYRMYELEELNHAFRFMSFNEDENEDENEDVDEDEDEETEIAEDVEALASGRLRSGLLPISSINVSGRLGSPNRIIPVFGLSRFPAIDFTEYHQNPVVFPIFSRPENPQDEFTKQEIEGLSSLLSCFFDLSSLKPTDNGFIEEILSKIKMGNEIKAGLEMIDEEKMIKFRKLPVSEKKIIRKWLITLFETGMYMRKWVGPGHPYPILERDTYTNTQGSNLENGQLSHGINLFSGSSDPIHEQRSLSSILALKEIEEAISPDLINLLYSLTGCNLIRGRVYRDRMDLGTRLKIITTMGNKTTDACIRLSSTILVGSGYIYICKIFHQKIQGFDPNLIDQIA